MFGQIAKERELLPCPIVVDVAGKLTCDIKEAKHLIDSVCDPFIILYTLIYILMYLDERNGHEKIRFI